MISKKRILYVDDNPNNRLIIRRILENEGHELIEACDGEQGWDRTLAEQPDFIIVDLLMPGIDGFTLTRRIKATPKLRHIPIVTLTAYGTPDVARKAQEIGCLKLLHKPIDVSKFKTELKDYL
ncbi:MAG: response regulator [Chloroflexota bacterium]